MCDLVRSSIRNQSNHLFFSWTNCRKHFYAASKNVAIVGRNLSSLYYKLRFVAIYNECANDFMFHRSRFVVKAFVSFYSSHSLSELVFARVSLLVQQTDSRSKIPLLQSTQLHLFSFVSFCVNLTLIRLSSLSSTLKIQILVFVSQFDRRSLFVVGPSLRVVPSFVWNFVHLTVDSILNLTPIKLSIFLCTNERSINRKIYSEYHL